MVVMLGAKLVDMKVVLRVVRTDWWKVVMLDVTKVEL
jgi:hypothetical protein